MRPFDLPPGSPDWWQAELSRPAECRFAETGKCDAKFKKPVRDDHDVRGHEHAEEPRAATTQAGTPPPGRGFISDPGIYYPHWYRADNSVYFMPNRNNLISLLAVRAE
jgi:hypothetical protein